MPIINEHFDYEKFEKVTGKFFKHKSKNLGMIDGIEVANMPFYVTRVGPVNGSQQIYVVPSAGDYIPWDAFYHVCEECAEPMGDGGETIVRNKELFDDLNDLGWLKGKPPVEEVKAKVQEFKVEAQIIESVYAKSIFDNYDTEKVSVEIDFPDLDMTRMMLTKSKDIDKFYSDLIMCVKNRITRQSLEKVLNQ